MQDIFRDISIRTYNEVEWRGARRLLEETTGIKDSSNKEYSHPSQVYVFVDRYSKIKSWAWPRVNSQEITYFLLSYLLLGKDLEKIKKILRKIKKQKA